MRSFINDITTLFFHNFLSVLNWKHLKIKFSNSYLNWIRPIISRSTWSMMERYLSAQYFIYFFYLVSFMHIIKMLKKSFFCHSCTFSISIRQTIILKLTVNIPINLYVMRIFSVLAKVVSSWKKSLKKLQLLSSIWYWLLSIVTISFVTICLFQTSHYPTNPLLQEKKNYKWNNILISHILPFDSFLSLFRDKY